MEKRKRNFKDDILDLRKAVELLDYLENISDDDKLFDTIYRTKVNLKILVYDLEEVVQCD